MLSLWLPIVLSAVFVFVLSAVIHMALPWHKGDYKKIPDEEKVRAALRPFDIPPGDYMMPMCDDGNFNSPEFRAKLDAGPNAMITMLPKGCMPMGLTFVQWFTYLLVIGFLTAYVARLALPTGASGMAVLRLVSATAFLAHAGALWPQSIWMRKNWGSTLRSAVDGLAYALVTGGTFAWLWTR